MTSLRCIVIVALMLVTIGQSRVEVEKNCSDNYGLTRAHVKPSNFRKSGIMWQLACVNLTLETSLENCNQTVLVSSDRAQAKFCCPNYNVLRKVSVRQKNNKNYFEMLFECCHPKDKCLANCQTVSQKSSKETIGVLYGIEFDNTIFHPSVFYECELRDRLTTSCPTVTNCFNTTVTSPPNDYYFY